MWCVFVFSLFHAFPSSTVAVRKTVRVLQRERGRLPRHSRRPAASWWGPGQLRRVGVLEGERPENGLVWASCFERVPLADIRCCFEPVSWRRARSQRKRVNARTSLSYNSIYKKLDIFSNVRFTALRGFFGTLLVVWIFTYVLLTYTRLNITVWRLLIDY